MLIAGLLTAGMAMAPASAPACARDLSAEKEIGSVEAVFGTDRTNQYVLDIEAALARAQAAHGCHTAGGSRRDHAQSKRSLCAPR